MALLDSFYYSRETMTELRAALIQAANAIADALEARAAEPAAKPRREGRKKVREIPPIDEFTVRRALEANRKAGLL